MVTRTLDSNRKLFWIYVLKRVLFSVLMLFIVSIIIFTIFHQFYENYRREALTWDYGWNGNRDILYGMDENHEKNYVEQYIAWMKGIFIGDFGQSLYSNGK